MIMNKTAKLNQFVSKYFMSFITDNEETRKYSDKRHVYTKAAHTDMNWFYSYDTLIAYMSDKGNKLYLNNLYYSNTTSRVQRTLRNMAETYGIEIVECDDDDALKATYLCDENLI